MKKTYKILIALLIVITSSAAILYYLLEDYWKFDRFYINEIEQYEKVRNVLIGRKKYNYKAVFSDNVKAIHYMGNRNVSFTISEDDSLFTKVNEPKIHQLFTEGLAERIIVLKSGAILFNLKWCDRANCIEDSQGFHGFYVHLLTKDKIELEDTAYRQLVDMKQVDGWTYYIVFYRKG